MATLSPDTVANTGSLGEHRVIVKATWRLLHGQMGARQMAVEAAQRHGVSTVPDLRKIGGRAAEARAQLDREYSDNVRTLVAERDGIDARLADLQSASEKLVEDIESGGDEANPTIVRMRRTIAAVLSVGVVLTAVVATSLADPGKATRLLWPGIAAMCLAGLAGALAGVVLIRHRSLWVYVGVGAAGAAVVTVAILAARLAGASAQEAAIRGVGALCCGAGVAVVWWLTIRADGPRRLDEMTRRLMSLQSEARRLRARRADIAAAIESANARHRALVRELHGVAERALSTFIETVAEQHAARGDLNAVDSQLRSVADDLLARLAEVGEATHAAGADARSSS